MGEDMDTHTRSILTAQQLNRELQFVSNGIIEINTKCYREEGGAHSPTGLSGCAELGPRGGE